MSEPKIPDGLKLDVWYEKKFAQGRCIQYDTYATLTNAYGVVVGRGNAVCSPKDQPVKKTGRHKAVGRAVQDYMRGLRARAARLDEAFNNLGLHG